MDRAERIQRIEYLAREDSDLGAFTAERMEFSELFFEEMRLVLNEVHDINASLRFWKLIAEDHLLAEVKRKDGLRDTNWTGRPDRYAIVNYSNFPTIREKIRNISGHIYRYLRSKSQKQEIDKKLTNSTDIYIGFKDLPVEKKNDGHKAILSRYYPLIAGWPGRKKRKKLNKIANRYESQFFRNVIRRIPKVYVEYFNNLYDEVELYKPEDKTIHVHLTDSLFETMIIAKYSEHGARLIWYQHGCYYGDVVHKYRGYFEHSTGDVFRTWGYKDHEIDEPWSAYRLEALRRKLPMNGVEKLYDLMISYSAIEAENESDVHTNTNYLLNNLNSSRYKKILARPRPVHNWVKASDQLNFISDPRVTIAPDGSSIVKQVAQSKIILQMRVPSTNFLECIYCNIPVIGLLINDQPTEIIKPHYKFLLNTGVLHHSIESVTDFLNNVDIENWWSGVTSRAEYKTYKKLFTDSSLFKEQKQTYDQ